MASKSKKPATPEAVNYPRTSVQVPYGETEKETYLNHAAAMTSSEFAAHRVIRSAEHKSGFGEYIDVPALMKTLRNQAAAVNHGDMNQAEAMLMNQATALQSLFSRLVERAMGNDNITPFEANMRMALRAQSQCRATLETLAAIKNPPIVYARQANVITGPQQINNGTAVSSRTREIKSEQTQLSGGTHELLPDARAPGNESQVNPALETLEEIDRAKVRKG